MNLDSNPPEKVLGSVSYDITDVDVYKASPYFGSRVLRSDQGRIGVFVDLCCARIRGEYYCARQSKPQLLTQNPRAYSLIDAEGLTYCHMHAKWFKMRFDDPESSDESN